MEMPNVPQALVAELNKLAQLPDVRRAAARLAASRVAAALPLIKAAGEPEKEAAALAAVEQAALAQVVLRRWRQAMKAWTLDKQRRRARRQAMKEAWRAALDQAMLEQRLVKQRLDALHRRALRKEAALQAEQGAAASPAV